MTWHQHLEEIKSFLLIQREINVTPQEKDDSRQMKKRKNEEEREEKEKKREKRVISLPRK